MELYDKKSNDRLVKAETDRAHKLYSGMSLSEAKAELQDVRDLISKQNKDPYSVITDTRALVFRESFLNAKVENASRVAAPDTDPAPLVVPSQAAAAPPASASARFEALVQTLEAQGQKRGAAMREASAKDPAGHRAWLEGQQTRRRAPQPAAAAMPRPSAPVVPAAGMNTSAAGRYEPLVESLVNSGKSRAAAMREAAAKDPAGHSAWLSAQQRGAR